MKLKYMSRRHKETDIQATQPHMVEPAADCRQQTTETYSSSNTQVLEEHEAVRKRPSIFIGNITDANLHRLMEKTAETAIDDAVSRYCENLEVTINEDNSISISNGNIGKPSQSYKFVDLFAGMGGIPFGYEGSGMLNVVKCIQILRYLTKVKEKEPAKTFGTDGLDMILGGSPCQASSDTFDEDDYPDPEDNDEPKGRGRPIIKQLCSKFSDAAIWKMLKTSFRNIYNYSIQQATNIAQVLVCFFVVFSESYKQKIRMDV